MQYTGFVPQPYYYPNTEYGYYNLPYYIPQNQIYSSENWSYPNPHISHNTNVTENPTPVSLVSNSVFSPDAPEFVSNLPAVDPLASTETSELRSTKKTKKKRKKPNKKSIIETNTTPEKTKSILVTNPTDKPSPSKGNKAVQFHVSEKVVKEVENSSKEKLHSSVLDYSRLFKEPDKSAKNSENLSKTGKPATWPTAGGNLIKSKAEENISIKSKTEENVNVKFKAELNINVKPKTEKNVNIQPKIEGNVNIKSSPKQLNASKTNLEVNVNIKPKENTKDIVKPKIVMSFADKLKSAPVRNPFLDWRDQRTKSTKCATNPQNLSSDPSKSFNPSKPSNPPDLPNFPSCPIPSNSDHMQTSKASKSEEDDFIQVTRRKNQPTKLETTDVTDDTDAKKKLERQKKKLREKEKKKKLRDEKLLAQKLAPKGLKISLISSKDMEKFKSSNTSRNSNSTSVLKMNHSLFPTLGQSSAPSKAQASESESEWETTETEVIPREPVAQPVPSKNIKRSDPIHFDLMALITKKSNKKTSLKSDHSKKPRTGFIANVLDRSAPVLSRGKIRTKKRKLSEIRKALLLSKAKKKQMRESNPPQGVAVSTSPSNSRTQQLHTKKFREYCDQILSDEIDTFAKDMLFRLRMFQDRAFQKDPIKGILEKLIAWLIQQFIPNLKLAN